jgi:hypothetical protein
MAPICTPDILEFGPAAVAEGILEEAAANMIAAVMNLFFIEVFMLFLFIVYNE